ncbi:MAG: hypothetical protein HXL36_05825 [Prevotellaceae bacterium]|nr:hypothetical protein [Prevotellaceae bacterium]
MSVLRGKRRKPCAMLPFSICHLNILRKHLLCQGYCSTAVSNAYDGRRTMRMTFASSAADGRRTMNNSK